MFEAGKRAHIVHCAHRCAGGLHLAVGMAECLLHSGKYGSIQRSRSPLGQQGKKQGRCEQGKKQGKHGREHLIDNQTHNSSVPRTRVKSACMRTPGSKHSDPTRSRSRPERPGSAQYASPQQSRLCKIDHCCASHIAVTSAGHGCCIPHANLALRRHAQSHRLTCRPLPSYGVCGETGRCHIGKRVCQRCSVACA